jgi:hypothetical protein
VLAALSLMFVQSRGRHAFVSSLSSATRSCGSLARRRLIKADHDPTTPMHLYRGDTFALTVRSVSPAARGQWRGR